MIIRAVTYCCFPSGGSTGQAATAKQWRRTRHGRVPGSCKAWHRSACLLGTGPQRLMRARGKVRRLATTGTGASADNASGQARCRARAVGCELPSWGSPDQRSKARSAPPGLRSKHPSSRSSGFCAAHAREAPDHVTGDCCLRSRRPQLLWVAASVTAATSRPYQLSASSWGMPSLGSPLDPATPQPRCAGHG
jgi:hypothetical protein